MGLVLKYVQTTKAGTLHYRRKVPKALRPAFGATEFKRKLGDNERQALLAYPKINAEYERLLAIAQRGPQAREAMRTALELHAEAERRLKRLPDNLPEDARGHWAESLVADYPLDPETGDPVGVPEPERLFVNGLRNGTVGPKPEPTFEDAKLLYLQERVGGELNSKARQQRVERVSGFITKALGRNPTLRSIGRAGAREVRDHMISDLGLSPATAKRYVNDIRAIVTLGIREYELDLANPFANLEIRMDTNARDERKPFTEAQLRDVQVRLDQHATEDLQLIFRLLSGTGCRLGEVTGLLVSDVVTDEPLPHLDLVFHPHRRLKTASSVRLVPLVGDALAAAKVAVKRAGKSQTLFAAYGQERGGDLASAALMRHVRAVVSDPKVVVHSTRHLMEDRMIRAGVDEYDRNLVLGHTRRGQGDRYGSNEARLEATTRALKLTFEHLNNPQRARSRRARNR